MKAQILFYVCFLTLSGLQITAQTKSHQINFKHFTESRGDFEKGMLLEIPYADIVLVDNHLNSSSGFGLTMNFHGNIVVIDQMDVMPDGTTQVVLRREDGRNFYGYKPTIKAILVREKTKNNSSM
ncbi:hypothetical protein DKG77_05075 [Flagellimonas aquimarina]|jgi:hypothetical protein|uniref:Uncharacterized protein n=1 Tax=Flagellimonas aquimarina TaxID=2201895 RepID=A0A316L453_9FLAO|nr:hypothetical protein [Allomuricauda koreensis]PWL40198.1 hypothetical protein DKG77_05075 [Allomuricauda koreensis]